LTVKDVYNVTKDFSFFINSVLFQIQLWHHRNKWQFNFAVFLTKQMQIGEHEASFKNIKKSYRPQNFELHTDLFFWKLIQHTNHVR